MLRAPSACTRMIKTYSTHPARKLKSVQVICVIDPTSKAQRTRVLSPKLPSSTMCTLSDKWYTRHTAPNSNSQGTSFLGSLHVSKDHCNSCSTSLIVRPKFATNVVIAICKPFKRIEMMRFLTCRHTPDMVDQIAPESTFYGRCPIRWLIQFFDCICHGPISDHQFAA